MRASSLLAPTLREVPAEAEVASHQLLLRGGFIRQVAAGIYTYLPLAYRVIAKIEKIIREEMDRIGGQEILLPILQPAEIWRETGRWEIYGPEMFRLEDRNHRQFCLGPTHEEIVTALVRLEVSSYRQLPLLLYQIQNKYRDERRPRFGLLRGREFIMKDMYSFDADEAGMIKSYDLAFEAYTRVFRRCGLEFEVVEADPGAIGGTTTHEFMARAEVGEAEIVFCPRCGYAANVEVASSCPDFSLPPENPRPREMVFTPGVKTVLEVASFLGISPKRIAKTLFYRADGELVCVLLRGDRALSETKLQNFLRAKSLELAAPEEVSALLGASVGFVGPVGLEGIKVYADEELRGMANFALGANKEDYHYVNVNLDRDFSVDAFADLRKVEAGEPCPQCRGALEGCRGIEVGQIFQLGTRYSLPLKAYFLDAQGRERPFVMGCYGIGVTRTLAAVVEQHHDAQGIVWPVALAPYEVVVVPVSERDAAQMELGVRLYQALQEAGLEVVLDDRAERAGVKFHDADLIGYPFRVTVGKKTLAAGTVDVKERKSQKEQALPLEGVVSYLKEKVGGEKSVTP